MGQGDGRRLEQGASRRAGQGPGDPDRQELRGGHRGRDHRRQRALPGLQHLTRGGARLPEAGRAGRARRPAGRQGVRRGAHRRGGEAVRLAGRQVLPAAVEVQPGDGLLQQGPLREGRPGRGEPAAAHLPGVPGHVAQAGQERLGRRRDPPGAVERVLPVVVRLLPALRRPVGQAARAGRQAAVQLAGGRAGGRVLAHDVQRAAGAEREVQRRRVRRREGGDGDRRPVGGRGLRQGRLGRRARADRRRQARRAGPHVLRREVDRDVQRVQEPRHGVGRPEVRHLGGAGRRVPESERADADAHRPPGHLSGLLRRARRVQDVRRAGLADRRGAERRQLGDDLADLPRRVLEVGDLRQGGTAAGLR